MVMVFSSKTNSGPVQSYGRVTGPNVYRFLELKKQGYLEPFILSSNGLYSSLQGYRKDLI